MRNCPPFLLLLLLFPSPSSPGSLRSGSPPPLAICVRVGARGKCQDGRCCTGNGVRGASPHPGGESLLVCARGPAGRPAALAARPGPRGGAAGGGGAGAGRAGASRAAFTALSPSKAAAAQVAAAALKLP